MPDFIHINPLDNVAVALRAIPAGTEFAGVTANVDIPQGHKMALKPLAENDQVMKYGFSIGHATAPIAAGDWVHVHNMKTNLSGELEYTYEPNINHPAPIAPLLSGAFAARTARWVSVTRFGSFPPLAVSMTLPRRW